MLISLYLGLLLGCHGGGGTSPVHSDAKVTDVMAITRNLDQFKHATVTLSGRFTTDTPNIETDVECEPIPEEEIVILEDYRPYATPWGIVDDDVFVGVRVQGRQGRIIGTRPAFEEGQRIEVTGEIRPAVVAPKCSRTGHRSFFLLVEEDALPFKPK